MIRFMVFILRISVLPSKSIKYLIKIIKEIENQKSKVGSLKFEVESGRWPLRFAVDIIFKTSAKNSLLHPSSISEVPDLKNISACFFSFFNLLKHHHALTDWSDTKRIDLGMRLGVMAFDVCKLGRRTKCFQVPIEHSKPFMHMGIATANIS